MPKPERPGCTLHKETRHPLYRDGDDISTCFLEFYKRDLDNRYECPCAGCAKCFANPKAVLTHFESCNSETIVRLGEQGRMALSRGPIAVDHVRIFREILHHSHGLQELVSYANSQDQMIARIRTEVRQDMTREHNRTIHKLTKEIDVKSKQLKAQMQQIERNLGGQMEDGFTRSTNRDSEIMDRVQGVATQVSVMGKELKSVGKDVAALRESALSAVPLVCYACTFETAISEAKEGGYRIPDEDGPPLWQCQVNHPLLTSIVVHVG
jgi:hypothetical protein